MPQGRGSKSKSGAATEKMAEAPDQEAPQTPNAVLVVREYSEEGDLKVEAVTLGDVKVGELLTVLELAAKQARAKFGLDS